MEERARYYWAAFIPDDGGYFVIIPDIENCFTEGDNFEDAMDMAKDVLKTMLQSLAGDKKNIPAPSSKAIIEEKSLIYFSDNDFDISKGIELYPIEAPSLEMVPVRINVSLPKAILDLIDKEAHIKGMTRSGLLTRAAQAYIG